MLEMSRSVSQLLFSYLPYRTVNWEEGGGVVQLDTPRLDIAWPVSQTAFVLREIGDYLTRWRALGGLVDPRLPAIERHAQFTVGTPRGISAHVLETAFYCRECFRFLPRLRTGANRFTCPDCRRRTLRQVSYVFVHGCGELTPIRDSVPMESQTDPGTIFWGRIRCQNCGDQQVLRLDARSERLSALRIYCDRCSSEVLGRPLARCPRCFPRLFNPEGGGQLAFETAMRITRHSANNAYYPHLITILRLDRPQVLQASPELDWLQGLLPASERRGASGISVTLQDLVLDLARAESVSDHSRAAELRLAIMRAASAPVGEQTVAEPGSEPVLSPDLVQGVRESIALLSSVRRTNVLALYGAGGTSLPPAVDVGPLMTRLGIRKIELVDDLPVVTASFGYTRRSATATYREEGAAQDFATTLQSFPTLDDDAARVLGRPQAAGTTPILAREGAHEGLAIYLDPTTVLGWLEGMGIRFHEEDERVRVAALLSALEPMNDDKYYDRIWERPIRRLLFGLLHSVSHCCMGALARTAGLEETSVAEYMFLPLLCTVVYSTSSTPLGGVRATARDRLIEFLETVEQEAMRCLYDPDCLQREGACHGCIHVPEIGCRVFNHGLSRAFLIGGHAPWAGAEDPSRVAGYWSVSAATSN